MKAVVLLATGLIAAAIGLTGCYGDDDIEILTDSLPNGQVGTPYFFELEVDGDGDEFLIVSGDLPPGISFSDEGEFTGRPTTAGTFIFTVEAIDFAHGDIRARTSKGFSLTIDE